MDGQKISTIAIKDEQDQQDRVTIREQQDTAKVVELDSNLENLSYQYKKL